MKRSKVPTLSILIVLIIFFELAFGSEVDFLVFFFFLVGVQIRVSLLLDGVAMGGIPLGWIPLVTLLLGEVLDGLGLAGVELR